MYHWVSIIIVSDIWVAFKCDSYTEQFLIKKHNTEKLHNIFYCKCFFYFLLISFDFDLIFTMAFCVRVDYKLAFFMQYFEFYSEADFNTVTTMPLVVLMFIVNLPDIWKVREKKVDGQLKTPMADL